MNRGLDAQVYQLPCPLPSALHFPILNCLSVQHRYSKRIYYFIRERVRRYGVGTCTLRWLYLIATPNKFSINLLQNCT